MPRRKKEETELQQIQEELKKKYNYTDENVPGELERAQKVLEWNKGQDSTIRSFS